LQILFVRKDLSVGIQIVRTRAGEAGSILMIPAAAPEQGLQIYQL